MVNAPRVSAAAYDQPPFEPAQANHLALSLEGIEMRSIDQILRFARNAKSHALYNYLPSAVDWAVRVMSKSSRQKILEVGASRILIDNTVIGHGITHETAWIDTGRKLWGGKIPIDTGFTARIAVHSETDNSDAARCVRYLPSIASLARDGVLTLFSSPELDDERMTQPIGRFSGYGSYDYNVFRGLNIARLPDANYIARIGPAWLGIRSLTDQRHSRLASKSDPLFLNLLEVLGPNNSQDAWHIATAENHSCYCFLTMDFRLLRAMDAQRRNTTIS